MKKLLIAVLFLIYFLFGHSVISPFTQVFADCKDGSTNYPEGTRLCKDRGLFNFTEKNVIECGYDGYFFDAGVCSGSFNNVCAPAISPQQGDRCVGTLAANPTPTPPTSKCDGGYSWKEQRCLGTNTIQECKLQSDHSLQWVTTGTCLTTQCQPSGSAPNRKADCPAVVPTATPDPDPKCSTFNPDNNAVVKLDIGAKICANYGPTQPDSDVQECQLKNNVAELVKIGTCHGFTVCSSDAPLGTGYSCKNAVGADAFSPIDDIDPACVQDEKPAQQVIPQAGVNCGIAVENLPADGNSLTTACCYSSAADMKVMPLSCFINLGGGNDLLDAITDKINNIIDCLPNISKSNCSPDKLDTNIANIRKILKEVPLCEPRAQPKAGTADKAGQDSDGTPLCTCERLPDTSSSQLCSNIKITDPATNQEVPDTAEQIECRKCMLNDDGSQGSGIWTAVGCINISSENGLIQSLFRIGIGIAGAIALLCNMYAAFMFQTSRGNPEGIKKAQDLITSCITGLLLIIFSVFILRLIGYSILRIPGFG